MKPCLVDVNVWIALLVAWHVHHSSAHQWFAALKAQEAGMCRLVQLAIIRLLGNRSLMGSDVQSASHAWHKLAELAEDERIQFVPEPSGIDTAMPALLQYPVPTGKLVGDAYLAAFAISSSRKIVTMDRGFQQFHGVEVQLLDV
jgi:toxin-antitoxin system PIN domain toxin